MTSAPICECPVCRESIRESIAMAFELKRRWMGFWTVRAEAGLGWVPDLLYAEIMAGMLADGSLLPSCGPADEFPRYLLTTLAAPARKRVER